MADVGRVRMRLPSSIKQGDIVKVRVLVIHPMEIVQRKDGKVVDKNYDFINRVTVTYLDKPIAQFDTTQSISENPFFTFAFRATEPGQVRVTFLDTHGGKYEGAADVKFADPRAAPRRGLRTAAGLVAGVVLAAGCAGTDAMPSRAGLPLSPWVSRAVPDAKGTVTAMPDGTRRAVRYPGWTTEDFGRFRTYAYDDERQEVPIGGAPMPAIAGDARKGRSLFLSRTVGPCTGCHLVRGADVWPAGNVGPDLSSYGDRKLPAQYTFDQIYDPRHVFPQSIMPAWGSAGILAPDDIAHIVAFLVTQSGPLPEEKDAERNPSTRERSKGFGDNLDPTNNPAVLRAEGAEALWTRAGPNGASCAGCHPGGVQAAMKGVATRYPRYVAGSYRIMSIEDFLTVHGPETTGQRFLAEGADTLDLAMLIKMASNGMPVALDLSGRPTRAALERGKASFYRRVGQRDHACADCHTAEGGRGAGKFLGGRLLVDVESGLTRHFPTWRTSVADVWDMRKRMQWCMTPLGTNMLAADAVEYAELELYLTSFDQGKPLSVPGIRH